MAFMDTIPLSLQISVPRYKKISGEETIVSELDIWSLMAAWNTALAVMLLSCIVGTWLGFSISNNIYKYGSAQNLRKALASVYCLCISGFSWQVMAGLVGLGRGFGVLFKELSTTQEISAGAQELVMEPDLTLSYIVISLFVLSVIAMQLAGIWMKKPVT